MRLRAIAVLMAGAIALIVAGCGSPSGLDGRWESETGLQIEYEGDGTYREFAPDGELLLMGEYTLESMADGVWAYEAVITHYQGHGEYWLDGEAWDQDDEDLWDTFGDDDVWDEVYDDVDEAMYLARNTGEPQVITDGYGDQRTIEWRLSPLEETSPPIEYFVVLEGGEARFYTFPDGPAEGDRPRMTLVRSR